MKLARGMGKARKWLSGGLAIMTPWRVGRVLAGGAMLAAGAALYFSMGLEEERGPSANSEITPASQAQVYTLPEDPELAEAPYDETSKNIIGIPAPSKGPIDVSQTYTLPEIFEDDINERVYDEMMRIGFVGIPGPRSEATDTLLTSGETDDGLSAPQAQRFFSQAEGLSDAQDQQLVGDRILERQDYQKSLGYFHRSTGAVPFHERYPFGVLTEEQMPEGTMPVKDPLVRENVTVPFEERYPFGILSEEQMPEGMLPLNDPLARLNVWSAR